MLTRLFSRKKATPVTNTPMPLGSQVLMNLDRVDDFPTLSDTAVQAMALSNNPEATLADFGNLVRRDGIVAAAVLKTANSWMFRGKQSTDNVNQAVIRLGLKECTRIITLVGMRALCKTNDRRISESCDILLRHSFFVACLSSIMNKRLGFGFTGEEFTAGLLHDIGRVILCVKAPERFMKVDPLDYEDEGLLDRERNHMATDHCNVGSLFATKNDLPVAIGRAILNHHRPEKENDFRNLVALIAATERLATHVQRNRTLVGYDTTACVGLNILTSRWDAAKKAEMVELLPSLVVRAMKETRGLVKSTQ